MSLPLTRERFLLRAFLKAGRGAGEITSLSDESKEADLGELIYEPSLKQFIQDSEGIEFQSDYEPQRVLSRFNDDNSLRGPPFRGYNVYSKHKDIIKLTEPSADVQALFSFTPPTYFYKYWPGGNGLDSDNYIISPYYSVNQPLHITALWFKENINLWSPKAIEGAISYAAFLISQETKQTDQSIKMRENEYYTQLDSYKVITTPRSSYINSSGDGTILSDAGRREDGFLDSFGNPVG